MSIVEEFPVGSEVEVITDLFKTQGTHVRVVGHVGNYVRVRDNTTGNPMSYYETEIVRVIDHAVRYTIHSWTSGAANLTVKTLSSDGKFRVLSQETFSLVNNGEERKNVVLEHREGEYVHWTIISDYYAEFSDGAWHVRDASGGAWERPRTPKEFSELWMAPEDIFSHGFLKPGRVSLAVPEEDRWVRATMKDGSVREFQVNTIRVSTSGVVHLAPSHVNGYNYHINNMADAIPPAVAGTRVVDWEYLAEPPRRVKWPKGATVQYRRTNSLYVVGSDFYEGDKTFHLAGYGVGHDPAKYQRVEITVVDDD